MSRFVSEYEGANEEKHGELCVLVGDKVHDDVLGKGIAVRMDGAMIIIEFLCEGGHLGRFLCRRRMMNEVLAEERGM